MDGNGWQAHLAYRPIKTNSSAVDSGLLLQQRWQHVGAEGEQAMQGDGGLGRCWVCGCGVDSALPAGRTVASTRSTEGERALRTRRGGAMLAAKQQIYLGGNYQPGPYRIPRRGMRCLQ